MIDITAPTLVELKISENGRTVWVNVDGECKFRACRIENLMVCDDRPTDVVAFTLSTDKSVDQLHETLKGIFGE